MTLLELAEKFPNEQAAREWFEWGRWHGERRCAHCQSANTKTVPREKPMPYWCSDCHQYFSVRTGTPMERSKLPFRTWVFAFFLMSTHPKGISSVQMSEYLGVRQRTAWFLMHRIREAWDLPDSAAQGPVEVDETYGGGLNKNRYGNKKIPHANGTSGKTPVIGLKDRATGHVRAKVISHTDRATLSGFANEKTRPDTLVYTDEHSGYDWITRPHEVIKHSQKEYVRDDVYTNSIESFWAILKRAYKGTYHSERSVFLRRYPWCSG